nr:IclR family transcriptional regulator C-terminal domain-containing protein [Bacillus sp. B15-48]
MQRIGKRAPLHATSVGKNILLNYSREEILKIIEKKGMPELTIHTITTPEALFDELENVKKKGYALDLEECEVGAKCLAVPLKDYTEKVVASISISGPTSRMTDEKIKKMKTYMIQMSEEISKKLAFHT